MKESSCLVLNKIVVQNQFMEVILNQTNFFVKELFNPELLENGKYCYYLVEKKGISHKQLLKLLPKDALFCGIKDKNATTTQWFCSKERIEEINEDELKVKYKGRSNEKIWIGKHKANQFLVIIEKKPKTKPGLIANYFGEQRFDSRVKKFEELIHNDFGGVLKHFLIEKSKFDSERSEKIKKVISENWGNWEKILNSEEIKGTGKEELFSFLSNNPKKFEEAFEFVERKSLIWMLKSCQALRFNRALNELVKEKNPKSRTINIFGETVFADANKGMKREIIIEPTEFEKKFGLGKMERKSFFEPKKFKIKKKEKFELSFELPRGSYATVLLETL
jgi:tRNA(Glu) U13 pseudouridine synthase TruD